MVENIRRALTRDARGSFGVTTGGVNGHFPFNQWAQDCVALSRQPLRR